MGKDVYQLGKHTVVTIVNAAGKAVEYVLNRIVDIGRLVGDLLKTIGTAIMKVVNFLLDLIPWKDIARTQKQLMKVLDASLSRLANVDESQALKGFNRFCDNPAKSGRRSLRRVDPAARRQGKSQTGDLQGGGEGWSHNPQ